MRVWFAPEDLKGGKKLHEQLFELPSKFTTGC
jgi:hypothetical protein